MQDAIISPGSLLFSIMEPNQKLHLSHAKIVRFKAWATFSKVLFWVYMLNV